jgi:hypothetical protein
MIIVAVIMRLVIIINTNLKCLNNEAVRRKMFNYDLAAVLNFRKILISLR